MKLFKTFSILTFVVALYSCDQQEAQTEKTTELSEEVDSSIEEEVESDAKDEAVAEEEQSQTTEIEIHKFTKDLSWIEKFFVKDNPLRLYTLLKYKEDEQHIALGEKLTKNEEMFPLEISELDTKNGYIKFFQPSVDCFNTMTYWNKSNGVKLIASAQNCCTMFCDGDINFMVYSEEIGYEPVPSEQIIPEYKELFDMTPSNHIDGDGFDRSIILPKNGRDIQFCIEEDCKILNWDDGKFILKEE